MSTLRCQLNEQGQINEQGGFLLNTFVCLCVCFFPHVSLVPNKRVCSSILHPRVARCLKKDNSLLATLHDTKKLICPTKSSIDFPICIADLALCTQIFCYVFCHWQKVLFYSTLLLDFSRFPQLKSFKRLEQLDNLTFGKHKHN